MEKFALLADLGVVTVSEGHQLEAFRRESKGRFWFHNEAITAVNFRCPTRVLTPGDKIGVRVFQQVAPGTTTAEDRLEFCRRQEGNVFVGAQGIPPVFEQKCSQLPRGFWYASLDARERLWKDAGGCYGVPNLVVLSAGGFDFDLGCFERPLDEDHIFFCFRDLSG